MTRDYSLRTVKPAHPPVEQFIQFLKSQGKRITQQRRIIIDQVFSHHDHFDADELMVHLQDLIAQRKVSRPTVYRTLGELTEAGLIRKMTIAGRSVYEHEYGYPRHDHLHCEVCNRLIEFHSGDIERLCAAAAREHDFEVYGHRLFVTGICRDCRRRAGRRRS